MLIAEIGLNHKGNEERAFKMLQQLVKADIDAVTFQLPEPEFYSNLKFNINPLSKAFYKKAINFIHKNNKQIGFAIKDMDMISFLDENKADFWKTLSTSFNDNVLIGKLEKTKKPIFMSTGLSSEKEIQIMARKRKNVKFIHTQLSHDIKDVNLKVIDTLKKITKKDIAFGLHCSNLDALLLSIAFSPSDIFFYVKDNAREKFLDHEHAVVINQLDIIIKRLKELEASLGIGHKQNIGIKI
ncbi:MAG: N-acetylneuraminate synthase family protein [Candidatus Daviesbacteria bacterium]|nr:N-acetylneuraminate synthase family protein [Candidatus Daviesbacteria bacterium]